MLALLLALFWISTSDGAAQVTSVDFDRTLRVDYFHTGGPKSGETFALDRVVNDGPWPGSRQQPIDRTNLGPYRVEARDAASGDLIYSRGFASVYRRVGDHGRSPLRSPHLSRIGPDAVAGAPGARRDSEAAGRSNEFADVWSTEIDPASRFVNPAPPSRAARSGTCSKTALRIARSTCC